MHKLAEICVRRPVFATVIILSLVVVGWFAYNQLGVDRFPKVDIPTITVSTRLVGAAPEEIETDITDKLDEAISGVGQVLIVGGRPRQINVVVDTAKMTSLGITSPEIVAALQSQNVQIPGGKVEQGLRDLSLRTYGRVAAPEDFARIPLMSR